MENKKLSPSDFEMQYDEGHRFPFIETDDAVIAWGHPDPAELAAKITEYDRLVDDSEWSTEPGDVRQTYAVQVDGDEEWRVQLGKTVDTPNAFPVSAVYR